MITPFFSISQDDEFIHIVVKISHVRFSAQGIEMIVDHELFIFSLNPYYLRIRLPFECIDDERSHAEYDSKAEAVNIKIPKLNKGQVFPDLDLTAKLLARVDTKQALGEEELRIAGSGSGEVGGVETETVAPKKPLIEELDVKNEISSQVKTFEEGEQFNWEISQTEASNPDDADVQVSAIKYGFNNQYNSIVSVSLSNGNEINELGDPETTHATDRVIERLIKENIKFDTEYYAADYIMEKYPSPDDDKFFKDLIDWTNPTTKKFLKWYKVQQQLPEADREHIMPVEFSKDEQEKMLSLPRKSYLIDNDYRPQLLVLLVSLLFSYHFDLRETEGEHNIESAWTVGKLTPQIAFLDSQINIPTGVDDSKLRAAVITSIRRALSYPLHRNYKLVSKVWDDVYYNLRGGKRLVLKSLLDLKELFRFHDVYYVYDKIWMEDLCAWLISDDVSEGIIRNLAHDLKKTTSALNRDEITFEKLDDTMTDEGNNDNDDEMVALSLLEIEQMAEELFQTYQAQQ